MAENIHPSQTLKRRALQAAGQKGPHGTYHCAWICLLCTYPGAIAHEGLDKRTEEVTPPLPDAAQLWARGACAKASRKKAEAESRRWSPAQEGDSYS